MQAKTIRRRKLHLVFLVAILLVAAAYHAISAMPQRESRYVSRIIDGDTIVVEGGERVRLLAIDTPERGEPCYKNATQRLSELIKDKDVILERHSEDKDRYGRLLRYIFVNDTFVNLVMVQEGYAHLYIVEKDGYYKQFLEAEKSARASGGCVWNAKE